MSERMPEVSVVFATRNRLERLRTLVESLRQQTVGAERFEVVIVDDGSSDDTPEYLRALAQDGGGLHVRTVRLEGAGASAARNAGWREARGAWVAFTDDDCRATPRWLEHMLAARSAEGLCFVQGFVDCDPREQHLLSPWARTLRVQWLGPYWQTANMMYPRELLERVGGFDQETFPGPGAEDADLGWRCIEAGAEPRFAPEALMLHGVHYYGPLGLLRFAASDRWQEVVATYARHPGFRDDLTYGVFWKPTHALIARASLALLVPRRWRFLRPLLWWPMLGALRHRCRKDGVPLYFAAYYLVHDLAEFRPMIRGSRRYKRLVL